MSQVLLWQETKHHLPYYFGCLRQMETNITLVVFMKRTKADVWFRDLHCSMRGKLQDTCVLITKTAFGRFIPSKHTEWDTIIALHGLFGILLKGYVLWYTVLNKIGTHWEDILIPVMRFLLRNDCGRSFQTSS